MAKKFGASGRCSSGWMMMIALFLFFVILLLIYTPRERFTGGAAGGASGAPVPYSHPDQSMFILANNECKPECCPSPYSCDKGCICMTEEQKRLISKTQYSDGPAACPSAKLKQLL